MKSILRSCLFIALIILFNPSFGISQKLDPAAVPAAVKTAFQAKFPGALKLKWKKKDNNFDADFDWKTVETSARFDPTGKWLETQSKLKKAELPQAIKDKIAHDYAGYELKETQTVLKNGNPQTIYEVHLKNQREELKIEFSGAAAVISKTSKPVTPK